MLVESSHATLQCRAGHVWSARHEDIRAANEEGYVVPCPTCTGKKRPCTGRAIDAALQALRLCEYECGFAPIERARIVLACWQIDPERYGLAGYRDQYPDAKRVDTEIAHMQARGWIRRVGRNLYRMTDTGREAANIIRSTSRETQR